ncbi:MAG: exosortase system-associated protein, TIGR04073 family [Candidatus Omnitrophota bacterium]
MNKFVACVVILLVFVSTTIISYAADTATTSAAIAKHRTDVGAKAARGTKNILFGWTEIPKKVADLTKETRNPFWGLAVGTFQGTLKAMARTVSGISDVVTAPLMPERGPLVQADISVD